jgi:hypothetical protein
VVDINHHHSGQARTEVVLVLVDLMLLLLLSIVLILTKMEVSIKMNSAASTNKVYKLTFQIILKIRTIIKVERRPWTFSFIFFQ